MATASGPLAASPVWQGAPEQGVTAAQSAADPLVHTLLRLPRFQALSPAQRGPAVQAFLGLPLEVRQAIIVQGSLPDNEPHMLPALPVAAEAARQQALSDDPPSRGVGASFLQDLRSGMPAMQAVRNMAGDVGRQVIPMAIGGIMGGAGLQLGSQLAQLLPESLPTVAKVLPYLGEAAGVRAGREINVQTGLETRGQPLIGGQDLGDLASMLLPPALRAAGGIGRTVLRHSEAGLAVQDASQETAAAQQAFAEAKDALNAQLKQIAMDASTDIGQKQQLYAQAVQDMRAALQQKLGARVRAIGEQAQGAQELANLPARYAPEVTTPGGQVLRGQDAVRQAYANVGGKGITVDPTPLQDAAIKLGIDLRKPIAELQGRFPALADALSEYGNPPPSPPAAGPIVHRVLLPNGQPWVETPSAPTLPAEPSTPGVPFDQFVATTQKLGQLVGKLRNGGGQDLYVAEKLYGAARDSLDSLLSQGTAGAATSEAYRAAVVTARRNFAVNDLASTLPPESGYTYTQQGGHIQLQPGTMLRSLDKLQQDPRFVAAFTTDELGAIRAELQRQSWLARIGPPPTVPALPAAPDVGEGGGALLAPPGLAETLPATPGAPAPTLRPSSASGMTLRHGMNRLLSLALLTPELHPLLQQLIEPGARIRPEALGALTTAVNLLEQRLTRPTPTPAPGGP